MYPASSLAIVPSVMEGRSQSAAPRRTGRRPPEPGVGNQNELARAPLTGWSGHTCPPPGRRSSSTVIGLSTDSRSGFPRPGPGTASRASPTIGCQVPEGDGLLGAIARQRRICGGMWNPRDSKRSLGAMILERRCPAASARFNVPCHPLHSLGLHSWRGSPRRCLRIDVSLKTSDVPGALDRTDHIQPEVLPAGKNPPETIALRHSPSTSRAVKTLVTRRPPPDPSSSALHRHVDRTRSSDRNCHPGQRADCSTNRDGQGTLHVAGRDRQLARRSRR
jgi:hypothetical protein